MTFAVDEAYYAYLNVAMAPGPEAVPGAIVAELEHRAADIIDEADDRAIVDATPMNPDAKGDVIIAWTVSTAAEMILLADDPAFAATGITLKRISEIDIGRVSFAVTAHPEIITVARRNAEEGGYGSFSEALSCEIYDAANPGPGIDPNAWLAQSNDDEPIPF